MPSPDPVAWIRQHRDRWPREVTLVKTVNFPAVANGKVYGRVDAPPGMRVQVHEIEADAVAMIHLGGGARVPIASTNLVALAQEAMEAQAKSAAVIKPTPAPTVSPDALATDPGHGRFHGKCLGIWKDASETWHFCPSRFDRH